MICFIIKKIDGDELNQLKKRTDAATLVIIFFMLVILSRLWFLQIHMGSRYRAKADNNRVRMLDVIATFLEPPLVVHDPQEPRILT